jgi:hypothetical protein
MDLPEVRPSPSADGLVEVPEREDAEPASQVEEPVEDLGARLRVGQGAMDGACGGPEVLGEGLETNVRDVGPDDPSGQPCRADGWWRDRLVVEA